jgi:cell division protein FtsB
LVLAARLQLALRLEEQVVTLTSLVPVFCLLVEQPPTDQQGQLLAMVAAVAELLTWPPVVLVDTRVLAALAARFQVQIAATVSQVQVDRAVAVAAKTPTQVQQATQAALVYLVKDQTELAAQLTEGLAAQVAVEAARLTAAVDDQKHVIVLTPLLQPPRLAVAAQFGLFGPVQLDLSRRQTQETCKRFLPRPRKLTHTRSE